MLVGDLILHGDTASTEYHSPVFARRGFAAVFSVNATHKKGNSVLVADVQHKNRDETAWASAGTFADITAEGLHTKSVEDIKEVVRLSFSFAAGGTAGDFFYVEIGSPSWRLYP